MKKLDKYIFWYLIGVFPFIVGFFIWESLTIAPEVIKAATLAQKDVIWKNYTGGMWDYIGTVIMIWFALAVFTTLRLLFSSRFREETFAKLGMIKERDEREVEITGSASKFSMIASIALLLFFLFFNSMSFGLKKHNDHVIGSDGKPKNGTLSLGFSFRMFDDKAIDYINNDSEREFNYKELPISKTGIILILIFWQVGTYHLAARRRLKEE